MNVAFGTSPGHRGEPPFAGPVSRGPAYLLAGRELLSRHPADVTGLDNRECVDGQETQKQPLSEAVVSAATRYLSEDLVSRVKVWLVPRAPDRVLAEEGLPRDLQTPWLVLPVIVSARVIEAGEAEPLRLRRCPGGEQHWLLS